MTFTRTLTRVHAGGAVRAVPPIGNCKNYISRLGDVHQVAAKFLFSSAFLLPLTGNFVAIAWMLPNGVNFSRRKCLHRTQTVHHDPKGDVYDCRIVISCCLERNVALRSALCFQICCTGHDSYSFMSQDSHTSVTFAFIIFSLVGKKKNKGQLLVRREMASLSS